MIECLTKWGKRFIVATAVVGGVSYCAVTSYQRIKASRSSIKEEDEELRCRTIYVGIQQSCFTTVADLLGRMNEIVKQQLNTESITAQLRENPSNKVALWETLKLTSFSSAVVSACVCSMVTVLVRIQLSVIASAVCSQGQKMTKEKEKKYLLVIFEMFEKGLNDLIIAIKRTADKVLATYSLKHMISLEMVGQLLETLVHHTASENRTGRDLWMMQYMLPPQQISESTNDITDLMDATKDALEIQDTQDILINLMTACLSHFSRSITDSFHSAAQNTPLLPLARVIPLVSDHSLLLLDSHHNTLLQDIVNNVDLMQCSRNVFEAFNKGLT